MSNTFKKITQSFYFKFYCFKQTLFTIAGYKNIVYKGFVVKKWHRQKKEITCNLQIIQKYSDYHKKVFV